MGEKANASEGCLKRGQVQCRDASVGYEDICRRRKSGEDGGRDVGNQMESTVNRIFAEYRYFLDIGFGIQERCHGGGWGADEFR